MQQLLDFDHNDRHRTVRLLCFPLPSLPGTFECNVLLCTVFFLARHRNLSLTGSHQEIRSLKVFGHATRNICAPLFVSCM